MRDLLSNRSAKPSDTSGKVSAARPSSSCAAPCREEPVPLIIPRSEHCISRKDIDREVLKVLYRLRDHGYIAYLVGGSVRDLLLGKRPKDFDVGTNASPEEIKNIFSYSRIIGKRFRLVHVYFRGGKAIEVSTFRRRAEEDVDTLQDDRTESEVYGSPQEDAFRRDLTINGLFYNIADFSVIDYVGGMADLADGVIRTIGDPDRRFQRDPVRMLRAVRHAARTGFSIEEATLDGILRHREKIRLCALPRVRDELLKDMRSGVSSRWAELMIETGLFPTIFPRYARAFEGEEADCARRLLVGLLGYLDSLSESGGTVEESYLLALLAYPVLYGDSAWKSLRSERLRWATAEVRELLNGIVFPYDFKKGVRDRASMILANLFPVELCREKGNWPKRVWNRPTFPETIGLFNAALQALGLPGIGSAPHRDSSPEGEPRPKGRRRKRRRKPLETAPER